MPSKSNAILSSHRDAATRVSDLLRTKHNLDLKPSDALDVVATVLGAANWKTLSAMAKQGRAPRMADLQVDAGVTAETAPGRGTTVVDSEQPAVGRLGVEAPLPTKYEGSNHFLTAGAAFVSTRSTGKWCIFRDATEVDDLWVRIRAEILSGSFEAGMVATAAGAKRHNGSYVICVFTKNWEDLEDVNAARALLRSMGVTEELGYKRDIETFNNVYGTPDEWYYRA